MPTTEKKQLKKKRKVGRPTVITEEVVDKLVEAFKLDATVAEACYYAGINEATYFKNLERNPNFSSKVASARNYLKLAARRTIGKHIDDPKIATWYAERKISEEFGKKEKLELAGEVDFTTLYERITNQRPEIAGGAKLPSPSETTGGGRKSSEVQDTGGGEKVREVTAGSVSGDKNTAGTGDKNLDSCANQ